MDIILDFEREEDERVNALLELKEEEKVIDILSDGGEAEIIFASSFCDR